MIDFLIGWMVGSISGFFIVLAIWIVIGKIVKRFRRRHDA